MDVTAYQAFTEQLRQTAERDSHAIGLVALGSMADLGRRDQWSDHDFFLVVESGRQESYRQDLYWLPDADSIVMRFRETAHGLKVMYRNAHLIEFAIFDRDELRVARVNAYTVLVDKGGIAEAMRDIQRASEPGSVDMMQELLHVLSLFQVGVGRYARGERLSGHIFIKSYALGHLLRLLATFAPSSEASRLDNLDPFRRFESVFVDLGARLNRALLLEPPDCALNILDLIEQEIKPRLPDFPQQVCDTVRRYITANRA